MIFSKANDTDQRPEALALTVVDSNGETPRRGKKEQETYSRSLLHAEQSVEHNLLLAGSEDVASLLGHGCGFVVLVAVLGHLVSFWWLDGRMGRW